MQRHFACPLNSQFSSFDGRSQAAAYNANKSTFREFARIIREYLVGFRVFAIAHANGRWQV
ncbi:hypothetical protein DXH95_13720 [Sphingorhabdus pulchriflava]|uniref:Uncharacterized protein n=1 Tax=Sphingorhabdus pulchriflava TaxID=2292257 RepID=A0A371B630_9SPHN|nr:hypothetical protein DXH95_13720 [Sphingorhabdus pulchriflava]